MSLNAERRLGQLFKPPATSEEWIESSWLSGIGLDDWIYDESTGPIIHRHRARPCARIEEAQAEEREVPVYYRADHQRWCPNVPTAAEWHENVRRRRLSDRPYRRQVPVAAPLPPPPPSPPPVVTPPAAESPAPTTRPPSSLALKAAIKAHRTAQQNHADHAQALALAKRQLAADPDNPSLKDWVDYLRVRCLVMADKMIEKRNAVRALGGKAA